MRSSHVLGLHKVICNLITVVEACLIGFSAWLVLRQLLSNVGHQQMLILTSSIAIAIIATLSAFVTGAADFEKFASRAALLPGALLCGVFASAVAFAGTAHWTSVLLCGVTVFCAIYVAKVFGVAALYVIRLSGSLDRRAALIGDEPGDIARMAEVLSVREDVEVVFTAQTVRLDRLRDLALRDRLDEIVLLGPNAGKGQIHALAGLAVTLVRIDLDDTARGSNDPSAKPVGPWNVPALVLAQPPLRGWYMIGKRAIDLIVASIALVFITPFLLICAAAIKIETPGPVFFVQKRAGYRGRPFNMFKFRSMYDDMTDHTGSRLTEREGDERVTRVGAVLRRTSLDELPQIFNVFRGDMSIVGPRPHPAGAKAGGVLYDQLIPEFYTRYTMLPGITGWAQVNGHRGNTETEEQLIERYRADLQYAQRWNPLDDLLILGRTVLHLMDPTNAF